MIQNVSNFLTKKLKREKKRDRDRQLDRQTDRQTNRQTLTKNERQTNFISKARKKERTNLNCV